MDGPAYIVLTLPLPPSANRLQKHRAFLSIKTGKPAASRYSTGDYVEWQAKASLDVAGQTVGECIPWRYEIRVTIPEGRIDPDNRIKPIQDLLQKCGVITNDRHLRRLELIVDPSRTIDRALIEIWSLGPEPSKRGKK